MHAINLTHPDIDDIVWVINFIDHITRGEVFEKYLVDDKYALKQFKRICSTKALFEELKQFKTDVTGIKTMQFIPSRGILMELSGHISDACWAEAYKEPIPKLFPNFMSITMVQNVNTTHERLAGACLLIEAESVEDVPLLIIRGLNPLQNIIQQLDEKDFYEKFIQYCKELAQRNRRKLAIVIDDHSGGAATNRPLLFGHLETLAVNLNKVRVSASETTFNGYDITDNVYLID